MGHAERRLVKTVAAKGRISVVVKTSGSIDLISLTFTESISVVLGVLTNTSLAQTVWFSVIVAKANSKYFFII